MSKLSKKKFLENYSSFPGFHKELLKQGNVEWTLIKKYPQDYYSANSGSVPGMIYYKDTVAFAKKYHLSILQILDEFEYDCGKLVNRPSPQDETNYFNWLSWFAWENMMSEIISFLEMEN
ncbi:hypothetical protein LPB136_13425 [Tenacibaculum todarodis]|uniref:DUF7222 domain-containing protein n=1 Tax=Tenacibaculum todarodis TaxID=1850252 RepID=A0A1L3JMG0_9FLAO|nr:hypothetical protein [Tenacibaculum todarodis]APG66311.1 hypothetical protein LPB136_13425 [Tenacibaculum todarodis]